MSTYVSTVYTYQLNGATVDFKIPFDYLSRRFVKVTLLGRDRKVLTFMTDYRFMSPTLIRTTKAWGSSDGYDYIEIRRETSARDLIVDFSDGSILRAGDLNTANLQAMHIAEEARGLAADSLSVNDDGNLDARFRKIVNLGDPVGRKDAVNKGYIDDAKDGVIQSRDKALQYRNEAQEFRNQTSSLRDTTESIKNRAVTETSKIRDNAMAYSNMSNQSANEAKAQISKAQAILEDVRDEGVIANGYAISTIEHAKASAANAQAALVSATDAQNNKVACAGHEAATAVYEQRAREVESTVVAAKNTAEQKAKEANLSATKSNESKVLAEKARAAAAESASQTNLYKDSAAESAKAAARDAASATQSANNAIAQAASALDSSKKASTSEANAKRYSENINPDKLMPKAGGTFTGDIAIKRDTISTLDFQVGEFSNRVRFNPKAHDQYTTYFTITDQFGTRVINFPKEAGNIALTKDFMPYSGGIFRGTIGFEPSSTVTPLTITSTQSNGDIMNLYSKVGSSNFINYDKQIAFWKSGVGSVKVPNHKSGTLALVEELKKPTLEKLWQGSATTTATISINTEDSGMMIYVESPTNVQKVSMQQCIPPRVGYLTYFNITNDKYIRIERTSTTSIQITASGGVLFDYVWIMRYK